MTTLMKILPSMENGEGGVETLLQSLKQGKTAILLFTLLFITALMDVHAQSGQKYATGGNALIPADKFGSINYEGLNFYTNNQKRGSFTKDGIFEILKRSHFTGNALYDSLITSWKVQTQQIEAVTATITGDLSANKLSVTSTVIFNSLSGTGNGLVGIDATGELKRYNMTGSGHDVFLGDGTFGSIGSVTGWQWVGSDLVSNAQRVVIQRDLAVGGHITVGVTKIISNGSNKDTMRTSKELQIISDAERIDLRADTVQMKDVLLADKMRTATLTVSGDASVSGTVNSNEITTNSITTNTLTTNSAISSPKVITSRITSPDSVIYFGDSSIVLGHTVNNIRGSSVTTGGVTYRGLGLGSYAYGIGWDAVAIGNFTKVASNAYNSIIIGCGPVSAAGYFVNNIPNSIMMGTNSTLPTLTIRSANGPGTTDGKVGIGTSLPNEILEIAGTLPSIRLGDNRNVQNFGTAMTEMSSIKFYHHYNDLIGAKIYTIKNYSNTYPLPSMSWGGTDLRFAVSDVSNDDIADAMTINYLGNVGIGTTSPSAKLTINNAIDKTSGLEVKNGDVSLLLYENNSDGTNAGAIQVKAGGTSTGVGTTNYRLVLQPDGGNVGIGTTSPVYELDVCGTVRAKKFRVTIGWCDFVYDTDYKRPTWMEKADFYKINKRLMYIDKGSDVETDGLDVGSNMKGLTRNVEEISLDMIELFKENQELKEKIKTIEQKISGLKNKK